MFALNNYLDLAIVLLNDKLLLLSAIILIFSFASTFKLIPFLVKIAINNNLTVKPNCRSSHSKNIPQLGGLGIIFSTLVITFLFGSVILNGSGFSNLMVSMLCILILVAVGVKDDIIGLPAWVKLVTQIISSLFFMIITDVRIDNFYGIFGIHDLPIIPSYLYSVFVFIVIINSYNLIDGIDGLAGALAIVIFSFFLSYFIESKSLYEILFISSLIGGLLAFLRFNFSNGKYKIFMGDVGSLTIGFLLAVMAVSVLSNGPQSSVLFSKNIPVFILAMFALPFLDTLRVFIVRGISGLSPFLADKNHLHHQFLKYELTHLQITCILTLYSLFVIATAFLFKNTIIHLHLLITMFAAVILLVVLIWFFSKFKHTNKQ